MLAQAYKPAITLRNNSVQKQLPRRGELCQDPFKVILGQDGYLFEVHGMICPALGPEVHILLDEALNGSGWPKPSVRTRCRTVVRSKLGAEGF